MDKVIELLSEKVVDWLSSNKKIQHKKMELYKYSALITIQSSINILTTLLLGFFFGAFFENICFFITFKFLRKYSGGMHSSKFSICYLISVISNTFILIAIKIFEYYPNYYLALIIESVALIIAIVFAPIANKNKPLTKKESRFYKLIVCITSVISIGISLILSLNKCTFVFPISLAALLNSILIVIEILKKQRCFDKFGSV